MTGSFRGLIRFNSKETRGTERQSLKCALAHYTTWPLARPLNERRKNFDNDEIAQEPAVAKRMVSSDAQAKLMLASKVEPSMDSFQTWDPQPVSEAGTRITSGEMSSLQSKLVQFPSH